MSPKGSTHKLPRHQTCRRSCLPSCFVAPPVSDLDPDHDDSKTAQALRPGPTRRASSFSWSSVGKRKKAIFADEEELTGESPATAEAPSSTNEFLKDENNRGRSQPQPQPRRQQQPQAATAHVSSLQPALLDDRPGRAGSGTTHSGSLEPSQHAAASPRNPDRSGMLDPGVGLSILLVTLAVMAVFGRAGAALCLCASFYVLPILSLRVRAAPAAADDGRSREGRASGGVDLDSAEYKKRVVLEGLLERNGRRPPVSLVSTSVAGTR